MFRSKLIYLSSISVSAEQQKVSVSKVVRYLNAVSIDTTDTIEHDFGNYKEHCVG